MRAPSACPTTPTRSSVATGLAHVYSLHAALADLPEAIAIAFLKSSPTRSSPSAAPSCSSVTKPRWWVPTASSRWIREAPSSTALEDRPLSSMPSRPYLGREFACGMEVGLTSPNNAQFVALGTIQTVDIEAKCMDGRVLSSDYVEVLINIVLKDATLLPRAQGRVINMANAQAHCIPWPCKNVTHADDTTLHSKVSTLISEMSVNYKEKVAKKPGSLQDEMATNGLESQTVQEKSRKKRRILTASMREAAAKANSQAVVM